MFFHKRIVSPLLGGRPFCPCSKHLNAPSLTKIASLTRLQLLIYHGTQAVVACLEIIGANTKIVEFILIGSIKRLVSLP
jgi:hypothetical protein